MQVRHEVQTKHNLVQYRAGTVLGTRSSFIAVLPLKFPSHRFCGTVLGGFIVRLRSMISVQMLLLCLLMTIFSQEGSAAEGDWMR